MRIAPHRQKQWLHACSYGGLEQSTLEFTRRGLVEVVQLGRGEPIVLVPGLAGGWRLAVPLARRLARTNRVILYSLAGDLDRPGVVDHRQLGDYAQDLADLLSRLRLERPAVLGISFGGAVALELAAERPGLLGSLIVSGVEGRYQASLGARIAQRVLERFPLPSDNAFLNQFFNLLHGGRPEPDPLNGYIVERCWETDQGVIASRLRALESFDVTDRLWRIDTPTLVLAGSRDVVVPPARQRALAGAIPGARFELLPGAGHVGFLTHRADVTQHIQLLLQDLQKASLEPPGRS